MLTSEAAQALGLALHELATNAVKYGAWSTPVGRVSVTWAFQEGQQELLRLTWNERGGPIVTAPTNKGFGHVVIETLVGQAVGEVTLRFDPLGTVWTVIIPNRCLVPLP